MRRIPQAAPHPSGWPDSDRVGPRERRSPPDSTAALSKSRDLSPHLQGWPPAECRDMGAVDPSPAACALQLLPGLVRAIDHAVEHRQRGLVAGTRGASSTALKRCMIASSGFPMAARMYPTRSRSRRSVGLAAMAFLAVAVASCFRPSMQQAALRLISSERLEGSELEPLLELLQCLGVVACSYWTMPIPFSRRDLQLRQFMIGREIQPRLQRCRRRSRSPAPNAGTRCCSTVPCAPTGPP